MKNDLKATIFKSVALAMGVATLVLNIMGKLDVTSSITLLSLGLIALALKEFEGEK